MCLFPKGVCTWGGGNSTRKQLKKGYIYTLLVFKKNKKKNRSKQKQHEKVMMIQSYLCRVPSNMVTTDRIHSHSFRHTPFQHKHMGAP